VPGFLASVKLAGLNTDTANFAVRHNSNGSVTFEFRVANGVNIPGALSAFADQSSIVSDGGSQTLQLVFADGLAAGGFGSPVSVGMQSDGWHFAAVAGSNLWFGRDDVANVFVDTQPYNQDLLFGGVRNDIIYGSNGNDAINGGGGDDAIYGQSGNDWLSGGDGGDWIFGGNGNDQIRGDAGNDAISGGARERHRHIFGNAQGLLCQLRPRDQFFHDCRPAAGIAGWYGSSDRR
jgi:Ca2+-binding RTX toxin-like protein